MSVETGRSCTFCDHPITSAQFVDVEGKGFHKRCFELLFSNAMTWVTRALARYNHKDTVELCLHEVRSAESGADRIKTLFRFVRKIKPPKARLTVRKAVEIRAQLRSDLTMIFNPSDGGASPWELVDTVT
jgi:hypothetical protein